VQLSSLIRAKAGYDAKRLHGCHRPHHPDHRAEHTKVCTIIAIFGVMRITHETAITRLVGFPAPEGAQLPVKLPGLPLILAATIMAALFILMPFALLGSAYADMRLAPFALATALLAIGTPQRGARWVGVIALLFFGVRTVATFWSAHSYDQSYRQELGALKHIRNGARVLALVGKPCGIPWAVHRLDHLPSMVLVRRQAFSNDQWQASGAQLLTVRYKAAAPFLADPSQFVTVSACARRERMAYPLAIATFPRKAFDYVWVIQQPNEAADYRGLQPVWQSGRSALYRVTTE